MEALMASAIGGLTAVGIYLVLRMRSFPVVVGMALLSYAVNVFLFTTGRLAFDLPPVIREGVDTYSDPLPQALVLTAIVISFGMTAVMVLVALGAFLESDTDKVDIEHVPPQDEDETRHEDRIERSFKQGGDA